MIYIYGLYACGRLRYIGQTKRPKVRLREHWNGRNKRTESTIWHSRKNKWLRTLRKPPQMRILAIVDIANAQPTEDAAIRAARARYGKRWIVNETSGDHSPACYEAIAAFWEDPDKRARQVEINRANSIANWEDPEFRARKSAASAAQWEDPEFRARISAGMSDFSAKRWQDPEYRAKHSAAMSAARQNPEYQARQSAAMFARWQDPEYRAKVAANGRWEQDTECSRCGQRRATNPDCPTCRTRKKRRQLDAMRAYATGDHATADGDDAQDG